MCSMIWCTGSFWTSLTSVSCSLPLTSSSSTALARRMSSDDLVAGKGDVHGVGAVTVDDGGDLAGGAEAPGEALAEVLANLGVDLGVGFSRHGGCSLRAHGPWYVGSGFDSNASA